MSQPIDAKVVQRIAKLARLTLSDDEAQTYARQLADIVGYMDHLGEVDTDGVEPMAHALPVVNALRADEARPSLESETALGNAPAREDQFFRVPAVLDSGGA